MTIQNFREFLVKKCPNAIKSGRLSMFRGKRIAIDGHNWMYRYMAIAHADVVNKTDVAIEEVDHTKTLKIWLNTLVRFIGNLIRVKITPIFVIDGPSLFEKQSFVGKKRKKTYDDAKTKLQLIDEKIKSIHSLHVTPKMVEEKRKYLRQLIPMSPDDIESLRDVLHGIGVPCLRAKHDAEKLCSSLCIEGYVSAVISTDKDNLTFGCPRLITEVKPFRLFNGYLDADISVIELSDVLTESNMTQSSFIDFCIMMGCDYNQKINGMGAVRCYDKICQYSSLDNMIDHMDLECLNYPRCRKIFAFESSLNLLHTNETFIIDVDKYSLSANGNDVLDMYSIRDVISSFRDSMISLPLPSNEPPYPVSLFYSLIN